MRKLVFLALIIAVFAMQGCMVIDIKPGSDPNSIDFDSKGVIPIAILSTPESDATPELDATQVNPGTLVLYLVKADFNPFDPNAIYGTTTVAIRKNGTYMAAEEDVNGDGLLDLALKFILPASIPAGLAVDEIIGGVVYGYTYGGQEVIGFDSIAPVP